MKKTFLIVIGLIATFVIGALFVMVFALARM
jgi:hypothetical protein